MKRRQQKISFFGLVQKVLCSDSFLGKWLIMAQAVGVPVAW